jgi:DHA1 family inner membrane transport protein
VPVANLLGVPVGALLGHQFGWRISFWLIAALAALATLAVAFLVPTVKDEAETNPAPWRDQLKVLLRHQIALSYLAIAVLLAGMLAFATFQVPFLIAVTGVPEAETPAYLFVYGIGAIIGVFLGGWLTDWKLLPSSIGTLLGFAAVSASVLVLMHSPIAMFGAFAALGIVGYAFSTPLQTRIVNFSAGATTLAASFISTAFNLGYAAGALAGAGLLALGAGYPALPIIGIVGGLAAAAITARSARLDRA